MKNFLSFASSVWVIADIILDVYTVIDYRQKNKVSEYILWSIKV